MRYIPTIGLEVHVQLNTKTKIFCSCKTTFGEAPNTNTCPVCLALPGALPVLNKEVLSKAVKAGLAIDATIHEISKFDRKNYFYPDLPKAYQITQMAKPYCTNGKIIITKSDQSIKTIGVTRIHMEEDAGKLVHSENPSVPESYVDLNRAGTPLIEIVSEPQIDDSEEAYLYLSQLKSILEYIEVSDCNMEQGSLRCDANVSVRPETSSTLGTRVEIKNLNSFKGIKAAIDYEIERQIDAIESGQKISQETRLWNANTNQTMPMRSKEEAHDYRYFPDPDLVPIVLSQEQITQWKKELPELAIQKQSRFKIEYEIPDYDAKVLTAEKQTAEFFEKVIQESLKIGGEFSKQVLAKKASNWIMAEVMAEQKESEKSIFEIISPLQLSSLILLIEKGTISGKSGKEIFKEIIFTSLDPNKLVAEKGLTQISDVSAIEAIVDEVIAENPGPAQEVKTGKEKAIQFLIGQIMKKSKGKAKPQIVQEILVKKLS